MRVPTHMVYRRRMFIRQKRVSLKSLRLHSCLFKFPTFRLCNIVCDITFAQTKCILHASTYIPAGKLYDVDASVSVRVSGNGKYNY